MTALATRRIPLETSEERLYATVKQEVDIGVKALTNKDAEMAIMLFRSALQKLDTRKGFHDHLVHNLLLSYRLQIVQKLEAGENLIALSVLTSALNLHIQGEMALDIEFRKSFAGVFDGLGLMFLRHRYFAESVQCCRKAISIFALPAFRINLENALRASGETSVISDFSAETEPEKCGRHIFIACVPKSGSTFLKNVLVGVTGYRDAFMVYTPGQFEQDLYLPVVDSVARIDTVTQQHCRGSDANVQIMQAFGIRPVVLVRNIFDCVVSLLDFYDRGAHANSFFRSDYLSLDEGTRVDLLIDNLVPWYFQFVATWSLVEEKDRLNIFWLRYEEMIADKPNAIKSVLRFYGLDAPLRGIVQRVGDIEKNKSRTRYNKGVAGRGESRLSVSQKERIKSYARYFPSTDFSRIGL